MKNSTKYLKLNCSRNFFLIILSALFFSCKNPLSINQNDSITIILPKFNLLDENLPELSSWKVITTNKFGQKMYTAAAEQESISISTSKDSLCSILIFPITTQEFFCPAGCVYPTDFLNTTSSQKNTAAASFDNYIYSKVVQTLLTDKRFSEKENSLHYFNFDKLKLLLQKNEKDFFDSFSETKYKKWANSKLSYDLDVKDTVEKIFNPQETFSLNYKMTKIFYFNSSNKNFDNDIEKTFCSYIPLNKLKKEKGYVTIREDFSNNTIAFLINGRIVYFNIFTK